MKNETLIGVISPELQKDFSAIVAPIREQAIADAITHAQKNTPTIGERTFVSAGLIKSRYEGAHAHLLNKIKPEVHAAAYKRHVAESRTQLADTDAKTKELQHQNLIAERSLSGVPRPIEHRRMMYLRILLGFIYLAEAYFNSLAFMYSGGSPLGAYGIGCLVAVVEAVLSYQIAKHLATVPEQGNKAYIKAGFFALLTALILSGMGVLRSHALSDEQGIMPTWIFFALNLGMLITAITVSKKAVPSEKETAKDATVRAQYAEIDERKKQIADLEKQKQTLLATDKKAADDYQFIKSQVMYIGHLTDTHYRETIELFKSENCITRSDGRTPLCFNNPMPPLQLHVPNMEII